MEGGNRVRIILFLLLCNLVCLAHPKPHRMSLREVGRGIDSIASRTNGRIAVAFKDLTTGKEYYRNANESFHAASTIKTPVMIEVFSQARRGMFSLDDSLEVVNSFASLIGRRPFSLDPSTDSDDSLYREIGKKLPIRKLVFDMITVSSNLATDLLVQKVRPSNIRRTMRSLGAGGIRVLRGVEDTKAYLAGKNNTVTAKSLSTMFERLERKKVVSKKASEEMLDILTQQKFNDMIPARLPKTIKVAHKTGSSTGIVHDSGIVFLPDGRKYILVILSKNLRDSKDGINAGAGISKMIYDYEVN